MFVQRIGPNGEPEWVVVDEEGEDDGSVADVLRSSAYLDMLHDRPRAAAYARALDTVLMEQQKKKKEGGKKSLLVLEVGAGSGLLSCRAARGSSDDDDAVSVSVVACEQFPPMARLARRVAEDNGFGEEKVRVLCCRSEDLEVDDDEKDGRWRQQQQETKKFLLPARADVVVSEILDSLLVGEGVLPVMRDVSARGLMREDAVAIPSRGRVLVQAVRSRALGLSGDGGGAVGGGFGGDDRDGGGGGKRGRKKQRHRRCHAADGVGSRCPVPLHLDPFYLSEELVPLCDPLVLFDLDLARPGAAKDPRGKDGDGNESGSGDGVVVETSTVELFPERDEGDSRFAFDALALWWEVDLAPGVSLSTAPCWARSRGGGEKEDANTDWTDHWRSCWVPVPLCRRRRRKRGQKKRRPFVVRGVLKDTDITVEVLPPPEEEEEEEEELEGEGASREEEEEEEEEEEHESSSSCRFCSVPSLYSPSGDWGWGTARGSPAALLLEQGAKAAVERARAAATAAAKEGGGDGAAIVLVVGDGHGAARAAAAAAASKSGAHLRVLALQPSRAGCLAVERLAAAPTLSAADDGRVVVEARLLSDFLSPPPSSSVPRPTPAVALLAEPHYRAAEGNNLPWRLLDFWPRRDELVDRARLLPPLSPLSPLSPSSVTSPAKVFVVVAAISCPLLSRNYNGELKEVEGVSMRLVDEAFRRGIGRGGERGGGEEGNEEKEDGKERGARALFAAPLWQVRAKEVSPRAVLFSSQQQKKQQLDISATRASEALPASDEVELDVAEEEEVVHGVACWLRFEAASSEDPAATTTAADFFSPDLSGAPSPGSQAILLFHEPWRRKESKKNKTLRVRVTLSLDEEGKKVDGEVVAFC